MTKSLRPRKPTRLSEEVASLGVMDLGYGHHGDYSELLKKEAVKLIKAHEKQLLADLLHFRLTRNYGILQRWIWILDPTGKEQP